MKKKKSLMVEHDFFEKIVPYLMYLGQGEDFKLTTELSETSRKSAMSPPTRHSKAA